MTGPQRKPLHPYTVFVVVALVAMVALDLTIGLFAHQLATAQQTGTLRSLPSARSQGSVISLSFELDFWGRVAKAALNDVAILIGLGVVIELVDGILWRLTPEDERRGAGARKDA